jgi:RHH-type proline utilization regulon transcriptional repressor/proline dehydrogenase/delta 1-pyrroline-5-carboxylate dehydrogenase
LENGANTSFVHLLSDDDTPPEQVAADPIARVEAHAAPHPRIPLPRDMYGDRRNSFGTDLSITGERARLAQVKDTPLAVADAMQAAIAKAFATAKAAQPGWDGLGGAVRAKILRAMADALERHRDELMAIAVHEAGKTWPDAVAEVREATDFCRYYAVLAERHFTRAELLKGPAGETNTLELHGRGVFACISPWNFPLAIFTGQIAAALAAGNTVLAKPAEQTPCICCPGPARRWVRRSSAIRIFPASPSLAVPILRR